MNCLTSCSRIFHKSRPMPGVYGPWARRHLYRASPIMTCLKGHTLRKLKPGRVNCPLTHNVSKRQRDLSVWTCLMWGNISSSDKHVTKTYIILSYVKIYVFTNPLQGISAIITKYEIDNRDTCMEKPFMSPLCWPDAATGVTSNNTQTTGPGFSKGGWL